MTTPVKERNQSALVVGIAPPKTPAPFAWEELGIAGAVGLAEGGILSVRRGRRRSRKDPPGAAAVPVTGPSPAPTTPRDEVSRAGARLPGRGSPFEGRTGRRQS